MQKCTTMFSLPPGELAEQLRDVANWPVFLPGLESVTATSPDRYTFVVRQNDAAHEIEVTVRPTLEGVLWTVLDGPAWNGRLHVQAVDARRARLHLELEIEPRGPLPAVADLVEIVDGAPVTHIPA
jgi:hypothetical protein